MKPQKIFIYQALARLLGNKESNNIPNGTIEENGCGKFEIPVTFVSTKTFFGV